VNAPRSTQAKSMHFATLIPHWNSLDSVRRAHSDLEAAALVFFALLVLFDILAHLSTDDTKKTLLEKIGLCCFAIAVLAEVVAYPYGQRNDTLSGQVIGSLDAETREALIKSATALAQSKEAETKSGDAIDKAGKAQEALGKAEDEANKAHLASANALSIANDAKQVSREARQEADSFETDIASAKKQAAEAVLELARLKAPRSIKPEDQQATCRALTAFAGSTFDMYVAMDQEAIDLAGTIKSMLVCAKWVQIPTNEIIGLSGSNPRIGLTTTSGVILEIDETRTKEWKVILEAATLIFRSTGLDAKANVASTSTGAGPLAIHIFVGRKPQ
jgi:hypothetical protein